MLELKVSRRDFGMLLGFVQFRTGICHRICGWLKNWKKVLTGQSLKASSFWHLAILEECEVPAWGCVCGRCWVCRWRAESASRHPCVEYVAHWAEPGKRCCSFWRRSGSSARGAQATATNLPWLTSHGKKRSMADLHNDWCRSAKKICSGLGGAFEDMPADNAAAAGGAWWGKVAGCCGNVGLWHVRWRKHLPACCWSYSNLCQKKTLPFHR